VKFYQTKKFMELHKKWEKELKKSGFRDLEVQTETISFGKIKRPERVVSTLEYYTQASKFYWDYTFKSEHEKIVWLYHSEGVPYREIAALLGRKDHNEVFKILSLLKPIFLSYVRAQWDYNNEENNDD
jgi:hypothetical protein